VRRDGKVVQLFTRHGHRRCWLIFNRMAGF
jgi:hypothetical protein